eukprot:CAMPEP_0194287820 /NCGR_PEP_ID=MMETSP0169-20130528/35559_1 /TAXON_ID=218684 /ORGANISM="Corethron pennatum, Strain L29A3" /LENGTH=68 /DNA_ID=CAMNT_0039034641 /DNA_START=90 /DNA_END=292 /DNA_ORIENTATION=-
MPSMAGVSRAIVATRKLLLGDESTPWGDLDHLLASDLSQLPVSKIRRHLGCRGDPTATGNKRELVALL